MAITNVKCFELKEHISTVCLRKKLTSELGLIFNKNLTFVHQECVPSKYTTGAVHKPLNFPSTQTIIALQMSGLSNPFKYLALALL